MRVNDHGSEVFWEVNWSARNMEDIGSLSTMVRRLFTDNRSVSGRGSNYAHQRSTSRAASRTPIRQEARTPSTDVVGETEAR